MKIISLLQLIFCSAFFVLLSSADVLLAGDSASSFDRSTGRTTTSVANENGSHTITVTDQNGNTVSAETGDRFGNPVPQTAANPHADKTVESPATTNSSATPPASTNAPARPQGNIDGKFHDVARDLYEYTRMQTEARETGAHTYQVDTYRAEQELKRRRETGEGPLIDDSLPPYYQTGDAATNIFFPERANATPQASDMGQGMPERPRQED